MLYDQDQTSPDDVAVVAGDAAVTGITHTHTALLRADDDGNYLPSAEDVIAAYATVNEMRLRGQFDARVWAEEFTKLWPEPGFDVMLSWFCGCIMTGYDEGARQEAMHHDPQNHTDVRRH